jgi:selenide, water dikinase
MDDIKLMQFSPGSGCGCKISPKDLESILKNVPASFLDKQLIVGNSSFDDAAVYDLGNGQALISTTDFFTPIVDNPYDYGFIAAVNALSDVYAMGGKPLMAISILGWPLDKLPAIIAEKVLTGATDACKNAGIAIAGGHSIDIPTPIFGLAVNGIVPVTNIKRNNTATSDCTLFLTKPLGIGVLSTALKKDLLSKNDLETALRWMKTLNTPGQIFGKMDCIKAMTDVTGFGLGGHLSEICQSSNVNAEISFSELPLIENLEQYIEQKTIPGGTFRNFKSYGHKIMEMDEFKKIIICDPQTSGGLLVAVEVNKENEIQEASKQFGFFVKKIGKTLERKKDDNGPYLFLK